MALLEIKDLNFTYPESRYPALENINLSINEGEFVVICGESGCGKSTMLRLLKKQIAPNGKLEGNILYCGEEIADISDRRAVSEIGFVMQDPSAQIVTDKVWHELAFGLEGLGEASDVIRRRVAEISQFFGITEWYHYRTSELSGGQKQLLNLAAVMVMNPKVLLLDEPTGQLDPIAATEFLNMLKKLNRDLGVTVLLVEHRLEEAFPAADKVVIMERAHIILTDTPQNAGKTVRNFGNEKILVGLPSALRIYNFLGDSGECPLTVREGKDFLEHNYTNIACPGFFVEDKTDQNEKVICLGDGFFRYDRTSRDILSGIELDVFRGETLCILGANGAGKSTLLKILCGLRRLYRGKLSVFGKRISDFTGNSLYRHNVAYLPQTPQLLFVKDKVIDDLIEVVEKNGRDDKQLKQEAEEMACLLDITHLLDSNPFDLSGGEIQKVALAKILLSQPKIILLDEPTKGLDAYYKIALAKVLEKLKEKDVTIVMATHDIEFAAENSDRCAMLFDGKIISVANSVKFFANNNFYTTAASRISRSIYQNAVTVEMVVDLCKKNGKKNG